MDSIKTFGELKKNWWIRWIGHLANCILVNRFWIICSWWICLRLLRTSARLVLFNNIPWELSIGPLDFRNDEENVPGRPLPLPFQTPTVLPPVPTLCSSTWTFSTFPPLFYSTSCPLSFAMRPCGSTSLPFPASSHTLSITYIQPTPLSLRPNMALSSHRKTLKGLARAFFF